MPETIATSTPQLKYGLPTSPEAEKACLGALLLDYEGLTKIEGKLDEKDFFDQLHQRIFQSMRRLSDSGRKVDLITLNNELKSDSRYQSAGGEAYLTELMERVGHSANILDYALIIREKAVKRDLIRTSGETIEDCYRDEGRTDYLRPSPEIDEIVDRAQARMFRLAQQRGQTGFMPVKDLVHPVMESLEHARRNKNSVTGLSTGFKRLDDLTLGFQKSNLILLAARPSQGKTALALNIASYVGFELRRPVAFFSLEMSRHALMIRLLSGEARMDSRKLQTGYWDTKQSGELHNAASRLMEVDIYIDDTVNLSVMDVRARSRKLAMELGSKGKELGIVIVDYLQLLRSERRSENRQQDVSEISRSLKALAQDLNVPLLALSQLSRRPEERDRSGRPQLSDLRESGSLEQDADLVLMIYRPGWKKENATPQELAQAELIIAKQRNGPQGKVPLVFLDYCTRFAPAAMVSGDEANETETVE